MLLEICISNFRLLFFYYLLLLSLKVYHAFLLDFVVNLIDKCNVFGAYQDYSCSSFECAFPSLIFLHCLRSSVPYLVRVSGTSQYITFIAIFYL